MDKHMNSLKKKKNGKEGIVQGRFSLRKYVYIGGNIATYKVTILHIYFFLGNIRI